jgi:two-component system chemotaxis response regulator CheB
MAQRKGIDPDMNGARFRLVAMGASTGGPGAIAEILRGLGPSFPLPILLVVHVSPRFGAVLADSLDRQSPLPVSMASDGDPLPLPGVAPRVLLAPPDVHLVVKGGRLRLVGGPERHGFRPSVDALFDSIASEHRERAIGCLLSGMGRDGAAGLLGMRRAGAVTLVQDEASSAVFGMPGEAIQLRAASAVVPLAEMAANLTALVTSRPIRRIVP